MSAVPVDRRAGGAGVTTLLIDFDGTLANSLDYLKRVYAAYVRGIGAEPSDAEFEEMNGPPIDEVVRRLCARHRPSLDPDREIIRYRQVLDEGFHATAPAWGARALLDEASENGVACWIVTSNGRARVEAWLARNGFSACGVIVSGDDGARGKPSPEPYLLALERLELRPDQAIAIEDSDNGIASALGAGLKTIGIGGARPRVIAAPTIGVVVPILRDIGVLA